MPLKVNTMPSLLRISRERLDNQYTQMLNELETEIQGYRATGMNDDAIYEALISDMDNEQGVFGHFKGGIETAMDELVVRSTQLEQVAENPLDEKYKWILDPTAQEHCEDCLDRADMTAKTMEEWMLLGIPGSGVTECGDYCKCILDTANE
jgi:hypothetical protein